jgi:hypothetical protein
MKVFGARYSKLLYLLLGAREEGKQQATLEPRTTGILGHLDLKKIRSHLECMFGKTKQ